MRNDQARMVGRNRRVLVNDNPFAPELAQPRGEPESDRPGGCAIAVHFAKRERDLAVGDHRNVAPRPNGVTSTGRGNWPNIFTCLALSAITTMSRGMKLIGPRGLHCDRLDSFGPVFDDCANFSFS